MHTESSLAEDLTRLGLPQTGVVLVHSGYRAIGEVEGGPDAVVRALRRAAGDAVTLLAPTFTTDLIDPRGWPVPPPPEERARILESLPCFDSERSAPYKMGAIAHALWRTPGAVRSAHPVTSWAALGPAAVALTRDHPIHDPEGIDGPVGRAYTADARVLLLGVDHDANTTLHLAECLLDMPHLISQPDRFPHVGADGTRTFIAVTRTTKCSDGFVKLDATPEGRALGHRGPVGHASARLMRAQDVVRAATAVLTRDPTALLCDDPECVHCPTSRARLAGFRPRG